MPDRRLDDVTVTATTRDPAQPWSGRWSDLPPIVWRFVAGFAFMSIGNGLTMPYLFVYLSQVRGFPITTVGWIFAWMGLLGLALAPGAGTLIDRFGPRPVMVVALVVEGVSTAAIGFVTTLPQGFAVATTLVAGQVGMWPASTALLTRVVPQAAREKVYALHFMMLNAGLGIGGLVSSLLVRIDSVASFQRLYEINAATYLVYIAVLVSLPRGTGARPADPQSSGESGSAGAGVGVTGLTGEGSAVDSSWRQVLRDRVTLRVALLSVLAVSFGYAQMEAGLAAYAVIVAGVPARALGWAYAANTAVIVVGQLVTLRLIEGRRRSRMLAVATGTWSLAWVVIATSAVTPGWVAVAAVVAGMAVYGLGETVWAPVAPALVNGLAPEHLRGRYNALQSMSWTVGSIVGPATAGLLIGNDLPGVWVATVVGGTALAAVLFVGLRHHLTDVQDGLAEDAVAQRP